MNPEREAARAVEMRTTAMVRLGLCGTIFCAMVLLSPVTAAVYGDWHLAINGESTGSGSACPVMDGTDSVLGSFHWASSGLSFDYSYDGSHWYTAPSNWLGQYEIYWFEFTTNWPQNYNWGDLFIISAHSPGVPDFYCYL